MIARLALVMGVVLALCAGCVRARAVEVRVPVPTPAPPCLEQPPPARPLLAAADCPEGLELCYRPQEAQRLLLWIRQTVRWTAAAWLDCSHTPATEPEED